MAAKTVRLVNTTTVPITVDLTYDDVTRILAQAVVIVPPGLISPNPAGTAPGGTTIGAAVYQPGTTTTIPFPQSPAGQRVLMPTDEVLARKLTTFGYYVRPGG